MHQKNYAKYYKLARHLQLKQMTTVFTYLQANNYQLNPLTFR